MRADYALRRQPLFSSFWRRTLLASTCLSVASTLAQAAPTLPTGGTYVVGSGTGTIGTAGSTETITQSTAKGIINWGSFSIGSGGTVRFVQPNGSSITLNRVTGGSASTFANGSTLSANGQVWLINPNGIMFGAGSVVNVGGLIATTADMADSDFEAGNYNFSNATGAKVENDGQITASNPANLNSAGYVALAGAQVVNKGVITAKLGVVQLAAGKAYTVAFNPDGLLQFQVTTPIDSAIAPPKGTALINNSGTLAADGGTVLMTSRAAGTVIDNVINTSGIVQANSVALLGNGDVVLDAEGGNAGVNLLGNGTVTTGGTATLTSTGTIAEATGASVTAASLTGSSAGGVTLTSTSNAIGAFGPFTNATGGSLAFTNGGALTTTGNITSAGNVQLTGGAGSVSFGGTVSGVGVNLASLSGTGLSVGTTDVVGTLFISNASLSQINASGSLTLRTTGASDAISSNGVTAAATGEPVTLISQDAVNFGSAGSNFGSSLTVRPVLKAGIAAPMTVAFAGPVTAAGGIAIRANAGNLNVSNAISAGGNVFLEATNGSITGGATITANGGNLSLIAGDAVGSVAQPLEVADAGTPLVLAGSAANGDFILSANAPQGMTVGAQVPPISGFTTLAAPGVSATGSVGIQNRSSNLILANNVTAGGPHIFLEADGGGSITTTGGSVVFKNGGGGLSLVAGSGIGTSAAPLDVSSPTNVTYATLTSTGGTFLAAPGSAGPQPTPVPTGFTVIPAPGPGPVTPPTPPAPPPPAVVPAGNAAGGVANAGGAVDNTALADQLNLIQPAAGGATDDQVDCVAAALQYKPPQSAQGPTDAVIPGLLSAQQPDKGCGAIKRSGSAPGQDFFSGWGRQSLW